MLFEADIFKLLFIIIFIEFIYNGMQSIILK